MRVVAADDVMLTREGIARLLRDAEIDVVAQAENADQLLRHVDSHALTRRSSTSACHRLDTDEGLVAAQRIRSDYPSVGVLVLSQYVAPSYALRLLEEHPEKVGYPLKEGVFDDVVSTWRAWANDVQGQTIDCGHHMSEEAPSMRLR